MLFQFVLISPLTFREIVVAHYFPWHVPSNSVDTDDHFKHMAHRDSYLFPSVNKCEILNIPIAMLEITSWS